MFIIAGVSPKKKILEPQPEQCPSCGVQLAYTVRMDHYINLFFIPLFRVKKGDPFLWCENCDGSAYRPKSEEEARNEDPKEVCRFCGRSLSGDFRFCPYCGKQNHPDP